MEIYGSKSQLMTIDDSDDLEERGTTLEQLLGYLSVTIKRLAVSKTKKFVPPKATETMGMSGVQLPRIEVQTFDGNVLSWRIF